jgi:hypothetical protein|tara:strand:+ start:378 stop:779 length:402 start_codon:yes stop_codon:yes gene_type:complete
MARPTIYTVKLEDRMLEEIASGRSVISLCREEDWTPNADTWYRWMYKIDGLSDRYTRAKSISSEFHADQILAIADEADNQTFQVARLQIDARKWVASKLVPNKYGEKSQIDHTSSDESMKAPTVIKLVSKSDG